MTTSFHNIIKYIVGENNIGAPKMQNYFGVIKLSYTYYDSLCIALYKLSLFQLAIAIIIAR